MLNKILRAINEPSLIMRKFNDFLINKRKVLIDLNRARCMLLDFLSAKYDIDIGSIFKDYLSSEFKSWYGIQKSRLIELVGGVGTSSDFDCDTLYLLVRVAKPSVVVETGVLYGASSSHILEALRENGFGMLYSIDLPGEEGKPSQNFLVRKIVMDRWRLLLGDIKVELPNLLESLSQIDHFHHDSLHTFNHMLWEYETALGYLKPNGMLSSHDVLCPPLKKNAFKYFCRRHHLQYRIFRNLGICFLGN